MAPMGWLKSLYQGSYAPLWLLAVAALLVLGWTQRRKHQDLLWLACGMALLAGALHLFTPLRTWLGQPLVMLLCWLASGCAVQAMEVRFGRLVHWPTVAVSLLVLLGCLGAASYRLPDVELYTALATWALAALLGHLLGPVWRCAKRHHPERALQLIYAGITFGLICSPWLLGRDLGVYEAVLQWLLPVAATALALALLASAWSDGGVAVRNPRHIDAHTGLPNRAGFEAICGADLAEKNITVMALCDLEHCSSNPATLRQFAQLLQSSLREGDGLARIGQAEFAFALRQVSLADAQALVQRIQSKLADQGLVSSGAAVPSASFSLVQVRPQEFLNLALHRADVLLCQAKEDQASGAPRHAAQHSVLILSGS